MKVVKMNNVVKMNLAQIHGAIAGLGKWIAETPDFPFKPEKIEYAGELDRFGMHHYILKFRDKGGPWILGIAGGYTEEWEIDPYLYVGSMETLFSEQTMVRDAERLLDDMHQFFKEHSIGSADGEEDSLDDDGDSLDDDGDSTDGPELSLLFTEDSIMQIVFLPEAGQISASQILRVLRKNWHVEAWEGRRLSERAWEAVVEGWTFQVTHLALPGTIKDSMFVPKGNQIMEDTMNRILACRNVLIVTCHEGGKELKQWTPAFAMLIDACMEAGGGIGAASGAYWISRDQYHRFLQQSLQDKVWPFANFFRYEVITKEVSSDTIFKVVLLGVFALSMPNLEIFGTFSRQELPAIKQDLRELAEAFLGNCPEDNVTYTVSSGRRYRALVHRRDMSFSAPSLHFFEDGAKLDSTEDIVIRAARNGLKLKKIVEAGKRSAWFLRWTYERGGISLNWITEFERYLKKAKYAGDWRYALQFEQKGYFSSKHIAWKYRLFAESYYLGKGTNGYKGQLKAYALKRLKGTKQEGLARLAGINAFAYLPWDEETYHDVAAMIEAAYAAWQEEQR